MRLVLQRVSSATVTVQIKSEKYFNASYSANPTPHLSRITVANIHSGLVASAPSITAVSILILPVSTHLRGPMIAHLICTYIYPNYIAKFILILSYRPIPIYI